MQIRWCSTYRFFFPSTLLLSLSFSAFCNCASLHSFPRAATSLHWRKAVSEIYASVTNYIGNVFLCNNPPPLVSVPPPLLISSIPFSGWAKFCLLPLPCGGIWKKSSPSYFHFCFMFLFVHINVRLLIRARLCSNEFINQTWCTKTAPALVGSCVCAQLFVLSLWICAFSLKTKSFSHLLVTFFFSAD